MNIAASILEIAVIGLGIIIMLADLWLPRDKKIWLGYASAAGLALILFGSLNMSGSPTTLAFGDMYILDSFALFFKRFFLIAAILVMVVSIEFSPKFQTGKGEYFTLVLFALAGMMFSASANHFALLFVSLELMTITFYILTSFLRDQML